MRQFLQCLPLMTCAIAAPIQGQDVNAPASATEPVQPEVRVGDSHGSHSPAAAHRGTQHSDQEVIRQLDDGRTQALVAPTGFEWTTFRRYRIRLLSPDPIILDVLPLPREQVNDAGEVDNLSEGELEKLSRTGIPYVVVGGKDVAVLRRVLTPDDEDVQSAPDRSSARGSGCSGSIDLALSGTPYFIPDQGFFWAGLRWQIAPPGAYTTLFEYSLFIDDTGDPNNFFAADYEIYLSSSAHGGPNPFLLVYDNCGRATDGGCDDDFFNDSDIDINNRTTSFFNGEDPNQWWYVWIEDTFAQDEGQLEQLEFVVYWEVECEPDLIAYGVSVSDTTVYPGQTINVNWTVENQGDAPTGGSSDSGIMWSTNSTISTFDMLLDTEFVGSLNPGQSTPESHNVTIPAGANVGQTYWIGICVDWFNEVAESNEGNNCTATRVAITILQPPEPDLIAYGVSVSDVTIYPGQTINVNWTVENQGDAPTGGSSDSGIMWSTNSTISTSDTLLDTEFVGSLNPGQSTPESHNVSIPAGANVGQTYWIGICVDWFNEVAESNESNNCNATPVAVTIVAPPAPDLVVSFVVINPDPPIAGQPVTINTQICNVGDASTTSAATVEYYIDGMLVDTDSVGCCLSPGECDPLGRSTTVPGPDTPGDHEVCVVVYGGGDPGSDTECVTFTWQPPPQPDLIAYGIAVSSSTVVPGEIVNVDWVVENQGTASAGANVSGIMWSTDSTISMSDTLLDTEFVGVLNPGQSTPESHDVTIPIGAVPGQTYWIGICVDSSSQVDESDEGNNCTAPPVAITVQALPLQLVEAGMDVQPEVQYAGQTVTLSYQIDNPNQVTIDICLACSIHLGGSDFEDITPWLSSPVHDVVVSAAPGINTYQRQFAIPSSAYAGPYTVRYCIRPAPAGTCDFDLEPFDCVDQDDLDVRRETFGVTVITHGFQVSMSVPPWAFDMAASVVQRAGHGGSVLGYDPIQGVWTSPINLPDPPSNAGDLPVSLDPDEEIVLVFDWSQESDGFNEGGTEGIAEAAADALYAALRGAVGPTPAMTAAIRSAISDGRVHFIAHSRGVVVNSESAQRLGNRDLDILQVTALDSHPVEYFPVCKGGGYAGDPEPQTWSNVGWADSYYQQLKPDTCIPPFDLMGFPVDGACNLNISGAFHPDDEHGTCQFHCLVHEWYFGTIELAFDPEGGPSDRIDWYGPSLGWDTGFFSSEIVSPGAQPGPCGIPSDPHLQPPATVYNGYFELGSGAFAGWLYHGGEVTGQLGGPLPWESEGTNVFARVGDLLGPINRPVIRHNRLFVDGAFDGLAFSYRVHNASADDRFQIIAHPVDGSPTVTIVDEIVGSTTGWFSRAVPLPVALIGKTCTIEFRVDQIGGSYEGTVDIDDIVLASDVTPTNDACENAIVVDDGTFPIYNFNATTDGPDEPDACSKFGYTHIESDIWYRYFASCSGQLTVSLCGSAYDTKLGIYGPTCPTTSGEILGCNDDTCGLQSEVTFPALAGEEFLIRIGGYEGEQGAGLMTISCVPDCPPVTIASWHSVLTHKSGVGEAGLEIPDDGSFSEPRIDGILKIVIKFDGAVDPGTWTESALSISGIDAKGEPVDLSGISMAFYTQIGDIECVVDFQPALPDIARYCIAIDGVTSACGTLMAGDANRIITALAADSFEDLDVTNADLAFIRVRRGIDPINPDAEDEVRADIFTDGKVTNADIAAARVRRGNDATGIPDPCGVATMAMGAGAPGIVAPRGPRARIVDLGPFYDALIPLLLSNSRGEETGILKTADGGEHAYLFVPGVGTIDLGTLGGRYSEGFAISEAGDVVGVSETADGQLHAFRYSEGVMHDLGTLGGSYSRALGVNAHGEAVGVSETAEGEFHAFLWRVEMGMDDLNIFLPPDTDWLLEAGYLIDDDRRILGLGWLAEEAHLFEMSLSVLADPQPTSVNEAPAGDITTPDIDGDGAIGVGDLVALLQSWGVCDAGCPADLDGDGLVGLADLIRLVESWE